jgi:hypothetical protein
VHSTPDELSFGRLLGRLEIVLVLFSTYFWRRG